MKLYQYQAENCLDLLDRLREGRRVLYVLPTGAGKTVVAVAIANHWWKKGLRVLFLVHRRELVHQAVRRLKAAGLNLANVGVELSGDPRVNQIARLQVASVQTLRERLRRGKIANSRFDLVIVDEAHHAAASTWRALLERLAPPAVLGLTATPIRLDGRGLARDFDEIVEGPQASELIAADKRRGAPKVLARARVWTAPDGVLEELQSLGRIDGASGAVSREAQRVVRARVLVGDVVDHYRRLGNDEPALGFACGVEHAGDLAAAFTAAGYPGAVVSGETPNAVRETRWKELASGKLRILWTVDVVTEGWDEPAVKCVVVARPTASLRLWIQMCGRGARYWKAKDLVVLDHVGNAISHGLPQQDRAWKLQPPRRSKGTTATPTAKRCPECGFACVLAAQECECGFEFSLAHQSPREVDGELVEAKAREPKRCPGFGGVECGVLIRRIAKHCKEHARERVREHQRERRKDPEVRERVREYQRERRKKQGGGAS